MTIKKKDAVVAEATPQVVRLESKTLTQRVRSAIRLDAGSYKFNGVQFGAWNFVPAGQTEAVNVEYLQFNLEGKGKQAISLANLYDTVLISEMKSIGDINPTITPAADLSGVLVVDKSNPELTELGLDNVQVVELYNELTT